MTKILTTKLEEMFNKVSTNIFYNYEFTKTDNSFTKILIDQLYSKKKTNDIA